MIVMVRAAAAMLCPMARTVSHCEDDKCMAWMWVDGGEVRRMVNVCGGQMATVEPERPAHVPAHWEWHPYDGEDGACWVQPLDEAMRDRKGCCGMVRRGGT